jgi:membrane carboxypeptidase/penicillin-binding protein
MAIDNPAFKSTQEGYLKWKEYMNAFGLGVRLDVDLPSEDKGNIPDTSKYNRDFGGARWNSCNILTLGIGQDRMLATPLQLANVMCFIANKGYYYVPHFVDSIESETIAGFLVLQAVCANELDVPNGKGAIALRVDAHCAAALSIRRYREDLMRVLDAGRRIAIDRQVPQHAELRQRISVGTGAGSGDDS